MKPDNSPSAKKFKAGDRVSIVGDHPWAQRSGELVAYEKYGPSCFNWSGWRVKLDGYCGECYAQPQELIGGSK